MSTIIIKKLDLDSYNEILTQYKEKIFVNHHAYFRLSEAQRKIYKDSELIQILVNEKPALFGLQQNNRYTTLFSRKEGYFRISFNISKLNIEIVTFYQVDHLPKI
ncbi:MAG: hypothetical protein Q8R00_02605 [Candidatus Nanoarchaeia archaeon]|nr:hypothetical protein [Candidatus Nanoarchaeia archaeon]